LYDGRSYIKSFYADRHVEFHELVLKSSRFFYEEIFVYGNLLVGIGIEYSYVVCRFFSSETYHWFILDPLFFFLVYFVIKCSLDNPFDRLIRHWSGRLIVIFIIFFVSRIFRASRGYLLFWSFFVLDIYLW
jgi:hypothetical protein